MIEFEPPKKSKIPAYTAPEKWEEITVRQFLSLRALEGFSGSALFQLTHKLQILTGINAEVWANVEEGEAMAHLAQFSWTLFPIDWEKLPVPKTITIEGKEVAVPKDLRSQKWGQTIAIEERIDSLIPKVEGQEVDHDALVAAMPFTVAVLLQPTYDNGPFDEEKAKELEKKLRYSAASEVLPVGFFFLKKSIETLISGRQRLRTMLAMKNT